MQEIIKNELDDIDKPITDDFKRAFLTIKENDYYECWGSWSDSFKCPKRFLLNKNSDLVYFAKSDDWKKSYLKSLLLKRMEVAHLLILQLTILFRRDAKMERK